jgi:hypothetical protein
MLEDDRDVLGFCWGVWQIGNPWTDSYYDNKGAVDFWYHHSLISDETYNEIQKSCDYRVEPAVGFSTSAACRNAADHASNLEMAEIDAYNIYAGNCNSASIVNDSTTASTKVTHSTVSSTMLTKNVFVLFCFFFGLT